MVITREIPISENDGTLGIISVADKCIIGMKRILWSTETPIIAKKEPLNFIWKAKVAQLFFHGKLP